MVWYGDKLESQEGRVYGVKTYNELRNCVGELRVESLHDLVVFEIFLEEDPRKTVDAPRLSYPCPTGSN